MVKESNIRNTENNYSYLSDVVFEKHSKRIELISFSILISLIISIIMIAVDLELLAGCLLIITACLGIIVFREVFSLLKIVRNHLSDITSSIEKQEEVISDFSHRIREPLNNLVTIGDILINSGLPKKQKELLETFIASTNNMVTAVNELTMQSVSNISYESRKQIRFNLYSTVQNTIDLYSLKDKANIDFILIKNEISDFEFVGDPIILKQIFLDLFNTIESQNLNSTAKVIINLKRGKVSGNSSYVEIKMQVEKGIILINDKNLPHNLAAKLISSANGVFRQETGRDCSILNISLPFVNAVHELKHTVASPRIEELTQKVKTVKELKDIKILLVEDNLINQRITLLTLKPLVNRIDTAINGKEALDKFGSASYDLILMDIKMPVMSGLIAAEKIRALESSTQAHIPIIAITANAMLGDKESCISAGIDDYISKPFQPAALIEKIKNYIK